MDAIFNFVYEILLWLSDVTQLSYSEVNIIIWYVLIPLSWMLLLDKIYGRHLFTIAFSLLVVLTLVLIPSFTEFCDGLFLKSVDFLNLFNAVGSNYVVSSVIICVLIPVIIYVILIRKAFFRQNKTA